jgi:imidazolonepropionase-like amidohydrolase
MSVDVAPDGRTIVFDLLGDLYTIPITGGRATRLTSGMAFNKQPRYSPDGERLAFVSDRSGSPNLWISDAAGKDAYQLSDLTGGWDVAVTSPTWSPDGRTVVVSVKRSTTRPKHPIAEVDETWLLAEYDVATRSMRWLSDTTSTGAAAELGAAFSPDGRTLYTAMDVAHINFQGALAPPWWRVMRRDLGTRRTMNPILPEMWRNIGRVGMRPVVSRNGKYLTYASSSGSRVGLRIRDLRTYREWWLLREVLDDPPIFPDGEASDLTPGYAFTPDSRAIVIAYGGHIHRVDIATARSRTVPFVVDVERPMGPRRVHQFAYADSPVRTHSIMQPAISPDGSMVAFSALDRIWVMDLPDSGQAPGTPRRLTADTAGEFYPSWSPDGSWIAFSSWRDREGGSVRRADVASAREGRPRASDRISADTALYFQTAVAPDGGRVVAIRNPLPADRLLMTNFDPLSPSLVWMPSGGGLPQALASLADHQNPFRRPTDQLYFTADHSQIHVGVESWDWGGHGRGPTMVSGEQELSVSADFAAVLAPDERRALVSYRRMLFEITRPIFAEGLSTSASDTLRLHNAPERPFKAAAGGVHRWGAALQPWISWSRDGSRVLFNQGGTLFLGTVQPGAWTEFQRIDVPLQVSFDAPKGTVLLHGARVITMRGREVIERADILVRNNRIAALGPAGTVKPPSGTRVMDLAGKTILPGYADLHDHLHLPEGIHPESCWQCKLRLAYGVTTSRDPNSSAAFDEFVYLERERSGQLLGPRIFSTGTSFCGSAPPIATAEDAREVVRAYADYFGVETFKIHCDGLVGRRAQQLLIDALAEAGVNGTVHIHSVDLEVTMAMDGNTGIEHAPSAARIRDDVAQLIAQSGAAHTHTYGILGGFSFLYYRYGAPWDRLKWRRLAPPAVIASECQVLCTVPGWYGSPEEASLLAMVQGAARIVAHGGHVTVGSHGDIPGLGFHYELWLYALGGMSPHDILRAATIEGATAIGHARDLGSLEVGKLADLQILDKNPLTDIHNTVTVRYVMKNGRLFDADTLDEIWPRERPHPPHAALN